MGAEYVRGDIPDHVPPELVRTVDFYALGGVDGQLAWKAVAEQHAGPILYTPCNEGHWIVTSGRLIQEVLFDFARFGNPTVQIPAHTSAIKLLPTESNPPDHSFYRKAVERHFLPASISALESRVRACASELIEAFKPDQGCEFVADFASELPVRVFLQMMDVPLSDAAGLKQSATKMMYATDVATKTSGYEEVLAYVTEKIAERRKLLAGPESSAAEDLISQILRFERGGRTLNAEEALGVVTNTLFGGLDTVVSVLGFVARFLADNPTSRDYIRTNRDRMPNIVQELARRFSSVSLVRAPNEDTTVEGVRLKKGDLMLLPLMLHSLDESIFSNAAQVDFERKRTPNMTFGTGIHSCLGNGLARLEIRVFLEEWLQRVPQFKVKPGTEPRFTTGAITRLESLDLVWP